MLRLCRAHKSLDSTHYAFGENSIPRSQDFWVVSSENIFRAEEHLFVELLTRANARELYLNVGSDSKARESDQVGCDVYDPAWVAHVEQKHLTAAAERAGLKN